MAPKKAKRVTKLDDLIRNEKQLVVYVPRPGGSLEVPVRFCPAVEKERLDALVPLPAIPTQIGHDQRPYLDDTNDAYRRELLAAITKRRENFVAWLLGPDILGDLPLAGQVEVMKKVLSEDEIRIIERQGASPFEITEKAVQEAEERISPLDGTSTGD